MYKLRNQKGKDNLLKKDKNPNQINQKNKKTLEERDKFLEKLYKDGLNFMEKLENERENKIKEEKSSMNFTPMAWLENNKSFLEKVMLIFRASIKIPKINKEFDNEESFEEKNSFDKKELYKFLYDIGFSLYDFSKEENNIISDNNNDNGIYEINKKDINLNKENQNENLDNINNNNNRKIILKKEEQNLVNKFIDNILKGQNPIENNIQINSNDLFLYIIGVLNLFDYFIYSSYKKSYNENDIKDFNNNNKSNNNYNKKKAPKTKGDLEIKKKIIEDIKIEIKKKVNNANKYSSYDFENNLILTDENANNLKKDFKDFYINFMAKYHEQDHKPLIREKIEKDFQEKNTFKPKIDKNSKKLFNEYRRRIITDINKNSDNESENKEMKLKNYQEYIDILVMRKKRKEK